MAGTIDWSLYSERAVGRNSPSFADVVNRPLREVLTISGADPDASFVGFSLVGHTHDASAIVSGTLPTTRGGTGLSSPTTGGLLVAAGAPAMTLLAPGASSQVVKSNGAAWASAAIVSADVSDATSANTINMIVRRDGNGDFAARSVSVAQLTATSTIFTPYTSGAGSRIVWQAQDQTGGSTKGPFGLIIGGATFGSTHDDVMYFGYNASDGGGRIVTTDPKFSFQIEQDYQVGATHYLETYFEWMNKDGTGQRRPLFWQFDRNTGAMTDFETMWEGWTMTRWSTGEAMVNWLPNAFSLNGVTGQTGNTALSILAKNGFGGELLLSGGGILDIFPSTPNNSATNRWTFQLSAPTISPILTFTDRDFAVGRGFYLGGTLSVMTPDVTKATDISLVVRQATGQTTKLFSVQDNSAAPQFEVDSAGKIYGALVFNSAITAPSNSVISGGTNLGTLLQVGVGGGAPVANRAARLILNAPTTGVVNTLGDSYISYNRNSAGSTAWDVGLFDNVDSQITSDHTAFGWFYAGTEVAAIDHTGALKMSQGAAFGLRQSDVSLTHQFGLYGSNAPAADRVTVIDFIVPSSVTHVGQVYTRWYRGDEGLLWEMGLFQANGGSGVQNVKDDFVWYNAGGTKPVMGLSQTGLLTTLAGFSTVLGTITGQVGAWTSSVTWNNAAVTFIHDQRTITDTASAAASLFAKWIVGATTMFSVDKAGNAVLNGSLTTAAPTSSTARPWKLGDVAVVSPTAPNRTIAVDVNGTTFYLAAKTTND